MDECDDEHPAGATRKSSVPERRNGKPWEAGDVKSEVKERVVDEGLGWEVYEEEDLVISFCAGSCVTAKTSMLLA